jgi:RNA polymerase sigma-70 factor (ECF subfamily)
MHTTNVSLLRKLRSRADATAWSQFVRLYAPLVHRWVATLGIDEPDRSDVVQDVFVVLLGKMSTFQYDQQQSFRGWLRTITLNKCRDLLRTRRRLTEPLLLERVERASSDDSDFLTQAEYRQSLAGRALSLMRQHFSDTTWRACWLHVAEGRPAKEIAAELGITENAVYLARARVLKRLRAELEGLWE